MTVSTGPATSEALTSVGHPLLLFYDGDCSFCNRWAARVKNADQRHRTRFAIQDGATFKRLVQAHPELAKIESVVVIARNVDGGEDILIRSAAIRILIDGLPGFRLFALVLHLVPTPISDLGYAIFARLRTPLFGKWHDCRVPIEQDKELFLD
jgi:predicted DCC family thiol-disulfide oxidoreductase YuxK